MDARLFRRRLSRRPRRPRWLRRPGSPRGPRSPADSLEEVLLPPCGPLPSCRLGRRRTDIGARQDRHRSWMQETVPVPETQPAAVRCRCVPGKQRDQGVRLLARKDTETRFAVPSLCVGLTAGQRIRDGMELHLRMHCSAGSRRHVRPSNLDLLPIRPVPGGVEDAGICVEARRDHRPDVLGKRMQPFGDPIRSLSPIAWRQRLPTHAFNSHASGPLAAEITALIAAARLA
jgi:hypothetical protein